MEGCCRLEEEIVLSHRVVHTRTRQNQSVVAAKRRNHDRDGHHVQARRPKHRLQCGSADAVLRCVRNRVRRQHMQIRDIGEDIERCHGQHARGHRERQVFLGILELARREADVIPRIHREQRADHRGTDDRHDGQRDPARRPKVRPKVGGNRSGVPSDRQAQQDQRRQRRRFDECQRRLNERRGAHPTQVDPCEHQNGKNRKNPLAGESNRDVSDRRRNVQRGAEKHIR